MNITDYKDPLLFMKTFFPDYRVYKEQREILESLVYDSETFVPAGNC